MKGTVSQCSGRSHKASVVPSRGASCTGKGQPAAAGANGFVQGETMEKFKAAIIAVYSNQYLALDAKSGMVGENVMSEQFAAGLRLSG